MMFSELGRLLVIAGLALLVLGALLLVADRVPGMGRLPGDIVIRRDGFTLFAPCGTMIVLSLLLTIVINVILRILR